MTNRLIIVLLAFGILVGCTKDDAITPYKGGPLITQSPFGTVDAPCLVVSLQSGTQFTMEKYRLDGSCRARFLNDYFSGRHFINDPDFSAKGDKLCYAEARSIFILDVNSRNVQQVAGEIEQVMGSTEISPDGSRIAFLSWNEDLTLDLNIVENSSSAAPVKLSNLEDGVSSAGPPSFSPDGNRIAYSEGTDIIVTDLNGNNRMRVHASMELFETAFEPIFNKDGNRLIYFLKDDIGILGIVSSEIREGGSDSRFIITQLGGSLITDPVFPVLSNDGTTLYFVGTSYGYTNLYKVPVSGGTPVKIASDLPGAIGYRVVGLDFVEE